MLRERQEPDAPTTIAVIGGSGLYELFDDGAAVRIDTPYDTHVDVTVSRIDGRKVVFLPRHGREHSLPPHRIDARATIWALASLGVRALISTAAVGSLNPELPVGTIASPDQLVDRTHGRDDTYFDGSWSGTCPSPTRSATTCGSWPVQHAPRSPTARTVLVIQGPRFSTRAESRINRSAGIDLVNMTLYPEIALAAELGIDTVALCLVTDLDSGESAEDAVTADAVFAVLAEARPRLDVGDRADHCSHPRGLRRSRIA